MQIDSYRSRIHINQYEEALMKKLAQMELYALLPHAFVPITAVGCIISMLPASLSVRYLFVEKNRYRQSSRHRSEGFMGE